MDPENNPNLLKKHQPGGLVSFLKKITAKVSGLFKPEEVEVTFKVEGNKMSYTYKVTHKQVA